MGSFNAIFVFAASFFTLAFAFLFLMIHFWGRKYFPAAEPMPRPRRIIYAAGLFFGSALYLLGQSLLEHSQGGSDVVILLWHRFQHSGLFMALFFWPLLVAETLTLRVPKWFRLLTGGLWAGLTAVTAATPWFIEDTLHLLNNHVRQGREGLLYPVFQVWSLVMLLLIPAVLIRQLFRRLKGRGEGAWPTVVGGMIASIAAVFDMLGTFTPVEFLNNVSVFSWGMAVMCFCFAWDIARSFIRTGGELARANIRIRTQEQALIAATRMELAGKLASGVIHDLRNAVSIISLANANLAGALCELPAGTAADCGEMLEQQRQSIEIAGYFLENVRHFARGEIVQDPSAGFSAGLPLADLEQMLQARLRKQHIRFVCTIPAGLVLAGSRTHFVQVALNLVLNSIEALSGGGTITVSGEESDDGMARLVFGDDGPGIPAAERERVFDFLYTTKQDGSGIGLFIVRQIVEKNRGSVRVLDTAPGCSFEVAWPCGPRL